MKYRGFIFLAAFLLFVSISTPSFAGENNKFGMSLLQPTSEDIKKTAELVNSQSGDYGYVTLVIQENDRDRGKWQGIFEELRQNHLIPLIRIATKPEGENWRRPEEKDAEEWVRFLDSLHWVIKQRYIILFNEPNHATEWGGEVDPESYAKVAVAFAKKLKEKNRDYFVMLAGFDASAPSYAGQYEDEGVFIKKIVEDQPSLFNYIDGWASHSYPNPGFSGSVWDTGRKSIRGYEWELSAIQEQGIRNDFPVFITETGWTAEKLSHETISSYYKTAFEEVWGPDERVVAVTPFVFDYQTEPFLGFSWKKQGEQSYYPVYDTVKSLQKTKGEPEIIENGSLEVNFPHELVGNSNYRFILRLKNTGQSIWDKESGYQLSVVGSQFSALSSQLKPFEYFFSDIKDLRPFEETEIALHLKTNKAENTFPIQIGLLKGDREIAKTPSWKISVIPLPRLDFNVSVFPKFRTNDDDFELQIFDETEGLVYKKAGLYVKDGKGYIEGVQNIVPGNKYRIVILKPYYIPRQTFVVFGRKNNVTTFKRLMPFDFNKDGKLDWGDLQKLIQNFGLIKLMLP